MKRLKEISGVHAVGCSLLLARLRIRCGEKNRRDHERGRDHEPPSISGDASPCATNAAHRF